MQNYRFDKLFYRKISIQNLYKVIKKSIQRKLGQKKNIQVIHI